MPRYFKPGGGWISGESLFIDNTFIGFDSKISACGGRQTAITTTRSEQDYQPIAHFRRNKFVNQGEDAMFWMYTPSQSWAKLLTCGPFTCTGLY